MEYQSLQQQLQELLSKTQLTSDEREILLACYLNPLTEDCCNNGNGGKSLLQLMRSKGLIMTSEKGFCHPIPISLLVQNHGMKSLKDQEDWKKIGEEIEFWLQYPAMRLHNTRFKSAEKVLAKQWIFDLLKGDWERVYCFGDYEGFVDVFGQNEEKEWIRSRMKQGKKASVLATQDGHWAREIEKQSLQELRDCNILPSDFKDMFIMAFPEMNTTVMSKLNGDSTFVHSKTITSSYSSMVLHQMKS